MEVTIARLLRSDKIRGEIQEIRGDLSSGE